MPVTASELTIDHRATANEMAETIFGEGVTVVSASYSGDRNSSGIWSDGDATSPNATPSDSGVILSTGRVRDFTNSSGDPNLNTNTSTNTRGVNNDADFNALAGRSTYDAAILEADFIPEGARIFRLDDGLAPVTRWLAEVTGEEVSDTPLPHALPSGTGPEVSRADRALIAKAFRRDYVRFGYPIPDAPTKGFGPMGLLAPLVAWLDRHGRL